MKGAGLSVLFHAMLINITLWSQVIDNKIRYYSTTFRSKGVFHVSASSIFASGGVHMGVICEGLPVALLKHGTKLLSWSDLVGVRELLALHPLVDLVQSLLPFHGRHQLLPQLLAHVAVAHVALPVHVGVHTDLRPADLKWTLLRQLHFFFPFENGFCF